MLIIDFCIESAGPVCQSELITMDSLAWLTMVGYKSFIKILFTGMYFFP